MIKMTFKNLYSHKLAWILEHMFFAGIPVCLAVIRYPDRPVIHYSLMALTLIYMLAVASYFEVEKGDIGLRCKNILRDIREILPVTLLISIFILVLKYFDMFDSARYLSGQSAILYILISVPLQELVFRALCVWRCSLSWRSPVFITLFTSANFAFYHIFLGSWFLVVGVFALSLVWNYFYFKQKDIYAIIFSHALIGFVYFI